MQTYKYDLEDRLIKFAVMILNLSENLPKGYGARSIAKQIVRSGTAPALNYGEAQSAESPKDFLHKMRVCLKELRETQICLKIINQKPYMDNTLIAPVLDECNQLVAIFTTSVETKERNLKKGDRGEKK